MHKAVDELSVRETFRGYGHEQGYEFLRSKIAEHDYRERGVEIAADEIFLSDGSKCDCGHILDILGDQNKIAITDPVYPVYVDTNVMAGHTGAAKADGRYEGIVYLPCKAENDFVPQPPQEHVDLVYLCFPNNPTGAVASRAQLVRWVEYAREHDAILLFDAAYEGYISDPEIPHSIFEIPGARDCAIEFRSFSKTGGFTGVRCGFTVMPKTLLARTEDGRSLPLHPLWHRRWSTKANGVSYPVQRGAEALYSAEGRAQVRALDRALHGERAHFARCRQARGHASFWRSECSLHLGENARWPNELADVRPDAAGFECRDYARKRLWVGRRRIHSHLGI